MNTESRLRDVLQETIDTSQLGEVRCLHSSSVFQLQLPGTEAVTAWRKFRELLAPIAYRPVIVGDPNGPEFVLRCLGMVVNDDDEEAVENPYQELANRIAPQDRPITPDEILKAAEEVPFQTWIAQRRDPQWWAQHYTEKAEHLDAIGEIPDLAKLYRRCANEWRDDPPRHLKAEEYTWPDDHSQLDLQELPASITTFTDDYRRAVADSVLMLFVPVSHGWAVPAHLPFATMDDDRPPESHVAALRWLEDSYGAELLGISDRTLDVWPFSRPTTREEALRLAVDISTYATCPMTGDENTQPPQWAAYLLNSRVWSFCWP